MADVVRQIRATFDRGGYAGLKADDGTDVEAAVGILFGEMGDVTAALRDAKPALLRAADNAARRAKQGFLQPTIQEARADAAALRALAEMGVSDG